MQTRITSVVAAVVLGAGTTFGSTVASAAGTGDPASAPPAAEAARAAVPVGTFGQAEQPAVPQRYLDQQITWFDCGIPEDPLSCGYVKVPRDWKHPNAGVDWSIAITKAPPKDKPNGRVVFGNPGGPGASGLAMGPILQTAPGLSRHTAVGFDVRGTGASTSVSCMGAPEYTMDPRDQSRSNLDLTAAVSRMIVRTCQTQSKDNLKYVNTEQTVRDMDLIRHVLGYEQIDYVGYSGGTWLGAYYQKYFPKRAGRFVLDSNTDFTSPWKVTFEAQAESFERRFREDFTSYIARYSWYYKLGSTPEAVRASYEKLRAELARQDFVLDFGDFEIRINAAGLDGVTASSMYSKTYFQDLGDLYTTIQFIIDQEVVDGTRPVNLDQVLKRAKVSDPAARKAAIRRALTLPQERRVGEFSSAATFLGIICQDTAWPKGQAYVDALSKEYGPKWPLVGWSVNQQPCAYWPRPALSMPVPDGVGTTNTLLVQSANDPATNSKLAKAVHRRYHGTKLLWVSNEGDHGVYASRVNACVDRQVSWYLSSGYLLPGRDGTCAGERVPGPTVLTDEQRAAQVSRPVQVRAEKTATRLERVFRNR